MKSTKLFLHNEKVYIKQTDYKNRVFIILMSGPSAIHILTATLQIKRGDPKRGDKASAVARKLSTSIWVTTPLGTLTALLADIATFNAAVGEAKITAWNDVNSGLKKAMRLYSNAMGLDPEHAEEICVSGGFKVKKVAIKQKQVFGLFQGSESGTLDCVGDTSKFDCVHDWLLSSDGVNFVRHRPTPDSKKQFKGLKPGRWYVQHQCILANGKDGPFLTLYIDLI